MPSFKLHLIGGIVEIPVFIYKVDWYVVSSLVD